LGPDQGDQIRVLCRKDKATETACKSATRLGGNDTLNIWLVNPAPYLGFSYYPTTLLDPNTAILDGLMIWGAVNLLYHPAQPHACSLRT